MKEIEVSEDVYNILQIMKENSREDLTDEDVIKFLIHQISVDIENGVI